MSTVPSPPRGLSESDPFPPDCAEKFASVRRLAIGGFGAVHLAVHRELERQVAIKVLHADVLRDPEQVQRFDTEAKITASLNHPHIVQVLDHGAAFGIPWIAYEFVPGKSLRQLLNAAPSGLDLEAAVDASIQVAGALEMAHARGVIHRDVKPDNVLEAEPGQYKVTDFGIAKWARDGAVKTRTGIVLGTPAYVAPEQILGETATPTSDVYAMGVMLFELVTGLRPYEHDNPVLLLEQHLRAPIPRVSDRRPGLPAALERVLTHALAKASRDRYASAGEFAEALSRIPRATHAAGKRFALGSQPGQAGSCSPTKLAVRLPPSPEPGARFRTLLVALIASSAAAVLVVLGTGRVPRGLAPTPVAPAAAREALPDPTAPQLASIEMEAVRLIRLAGEIHAHEPNDLKMFSSTEAGVVEVMSGQTERLAGLVSATTPWLRMVMRVSTLDGNPLLRSQEALHEVLECAAPTLRHAQWIKDVLERKLRFMPDVAIGLRGLRDEFARTPLDARREALAVVFAPEAQALGGATIWIEPLPRAALWERAAGLLAPRGTNATKPSSPHALIARIFFLAGAAEQLRTACKGKDRSAECWTSLKRVVRAQVELAASWPQDPAALATVAADRPLVQLFIACGLLADSDWATPGERRNTVRTAERLATLAGERWRAGRHIELFEFAASTLRSNADLLGLKQDCPALFGLGAAGRH